MLLFSSNVMSICPKGFTYDLSKRICINNNDQSITAKELCYDNKTRSFIPCNQITYTPQLGRGK